MVGWTLPPDVAGVNAPSCWAAGASKAKACLAATGLFSDSSLNFSYIEKVHSRVTMQYLREFRRGCNSGKDGTHAASIFNEHALYLITNTHGVNVIARATP